MTTCWVAAQLLSCAQKFRLKCQACQFLAVSALCFLQCLLCLFWDTKTSICLTSVKTKSSYMSQLAIIMGMNAKESTWHQIWSFHRTLDRLCFSLGSVRLLIFLTRNFITATFSNCLLAVVYLVFHNDVLLSTSLFLSFHVCISGFWKVFGLAIKLAMLAVDVLACFPVQLLVYLEICRVMNWCP